MNLVDIIPTHVLVLSLQMNESTVYGQDNIMVFFFLINFYNQREKRLTDFKNKLMVTKGEMWQGKDKLGVWD